MLRQVVFAMLLLFAAAFDAAALEYTDVYFNPATAGRGFFLVQSEAFQFIALFIQGPDGKPTWYTAELTLTADGKSYTGPLYQTTGTYFGDAWDPGKVASTQVGTASFTPTDLYHATIVYSLDGGPTVTEQVQRQTLLGYQMAGNYFGTGMSTISGCNNPDDNDANHPLVYGMVVNQAADDSVSLTLQFFNADDAGTVCTLAGPLTHLGRLYRVQGGHLSCTGPNASPGNFPSLVDSLHPTEQGVEFHLTSDFGNGCKLNARFAAVKL